jgi:hypothetical protein
MGHDLEVVREGVDGRAKPGHDGGGVAGHDGKEALGQDGKGHGDETRT